MSALERFLAKVDKTETCWVWTASENGRGYGQFWSGERLMLAHRFAHEQFIGPIPAGLQIDHLCRNRLCVNPDHLEAVTCRENLLRGDTLTAKEAAQTHCLRGHLFDEHGYVRASGKRECRACARIRDRARYAASRAGTASAPPAVAA